MRAVTCLVLVVTFGCSDLAHVGDQARSTAATEGGGGIDEGVDPMDAGGDAGPPSDGMRPPFSMDGFDGGAECALDGRCDITDDCDDPDCIVCEAASACPTRWPMCDEGYCVECLEDEDCGEWECDDGFCEPD